MAVIAAILFLCTVASLVLAALVGFQDARRTSNLLFVGVCLCFALWSFAILIFMTTNDPAMAYIAAKGYYLAAGLFPALLLMFTLVHPHAHPMSSPSKLTMWSVGLVGVVIALLVITQPIFVIQSVAIDAGHRVVSVHPETYLLYAAYFVALFSLAMGVALYKFFTLKGRLRMQAGLYSMGILLNSVPGFIFNLYLPYYGVYDYVWVGPMMSVVFLGLTTYGILRHRMFSIRLAAVRSTAYVFTLATLLGIYYILALSISYLFPGEESSVAVGPISIFITIILAIVFQPIKRFFDKFTNRFFYRDYYSINDFFARFNRILATSSDLYPLLRRVSHELADTIKSEQVFFSIPSLEGKVLTIGTQHHGILPAQDIAALQDYSRTETRIIVADMLDEESPIRRLMTSHKVAMAMPLVREDIFLGFLCIGYHKVMRYSSRDLRMLRSTADELVIAIQNALSIQQIRDINSHLEQRIDSATKELRSSNAQLHRLDEAKDEFISMASHQLRTPLTSIKGYISMLLEGDMGRMTKEQEKVIGEVFISSERMVRLIGDFLNVSRLQTGKFVIEKHPVNLGLLVQREIDGLVQNASSRGLKFIYKMPKNMPLLDLDENKIQQVVMNFCDNAIYYSKDKGKITVSLTPVDSCVEFTVTDNGIGVPKDEQTHLFNKFFRATNARRARPDGTGVGLFLAKKVVDDHGGSIIFESTEGKGSTFGFRLPLPVAAKRKR